MQTIKTAPAEVWREYQEGLSFNRQIGLETTVRVNNDFYNDRQWVGVNAPDLDKPCINIIKPAVNYYVAQLVSDDVGASIEVEGSAEVSRLPDNMTLAPEEFLARIMQDAVSNVLEQTEASYKHRLLLKRMALDGDMALYSWFDPEVEIGENARGAIKTEIINNTDIFFGNPASNEVEKQPYIIVRQRRLLDEVRKEAERNGLDPTVVISDNERVGEQEDENKQYVTVLTKFFKAGEGAGTVHYVRCTDTALVKRETDLQYKLYPIAYASWENDRGSYHGVSPVTGKINNQIIINKMYALAALDRQNFSFPKVIYDVTKLPDGWNPDPGQAVAVNGMPRDMIMDFRPPDMSGQVLQLIGDLEERTKSSMGIFDTALGNARPDNTSAILAVQQAAATPLDLQRQDFYRFIEANVRIWLDMMSVDYGWRQVKVPQTFADGKTRELPVDFNFADIANFNWRLQIDIGQAARWSELMQVQMLDNLLKANIIPDGETYLECLPDGYLKNKAKLLEKVREAKEAAQQAAQAQMAQPAAGNIADMVNLG